MSTASIVGPTERLRRALLEALTDAAGAEAEASKAWCESIAGIISRRLGPALEENAAEYRLMEANLTAVQNRCTVLVMENRDLRRFVRMRVADGTVGWALEEINAGRPVVHANVGAAVVAADFVRMLPDDAWDGWISDDEAKEEDPG